MIPPRVNVDAVREKIGSYADTVQTAEQRYQIYKELIGFLPPRIEARINVTGALDPVLLDMQEKMRAHAMYPKCFDVTAARDRRAPRGRYVGGDAGRGLARVPVPWPFGREPRRRAPRQHRQARSGRRRRQGRRKARLTCPPENDP